MSNQKNPSKAAGIPEHKGRELWGLLLLGAGLLILAALISYHPNDPSVLHRSTGQEETRNWIGPVGAHFSAVAYGVVGLVAIVLPVALLGLGWRKLRDERSAPVPGRAVGAAICLVLLPLLLHLMRESISWRGETVLTGGVSGRFFATFLQHRAGTLGAFLIVVGGLAVGTALVVQTSLGAFVVARWRSLRQRLTTLQLAWERRRERRERERSRGKVLEKQVERALRERHPEHPTVAVPSAAAAPRVEPVRVYERQGPIEPGLRRMTSEPPRDGVGPWPPEVQPVVTPASPAAEWRPPSSAAAETPGRSPVRVAPATSDALKVPARARAAPQLELERPRSSELPPLNLIRLENEKHPISEDELVRLGDLIRERCAEFGVEGTVKGIMPGPVLTVFEFQPAPGVKVSQIVNLQDDLALALKAEAIRIDRMAGRSTLGIEVPNGKRAIIRLGGLLANEAFQQAKSPLTMALGHTLHGEPYYCDLATMPHLLVAGATGAGKSVGLQSMITSILYKARREEVQFIFIDPKRIELGVYADIPHLKAEVVVEPKKAANALRWAVSEMERRYRLLAEVHVRSIDFFNRAVKDPEVQQRLSLREEEGAPVEVTNLQPLPYYVVIIDELADLMMVASSEVETSIARLAQMARAVGIHLIIATQRPSVDVLTGTIKANFPCRISFATASRHDSRTILDQIGAEKLLGKGDMLFLPPGSSRPIRLHGAYVSEQETAALVRWLKKQGRPVLDPAVVEPPTEDRATGGGTVDDDELFDDAARLVVREGMGSASFLQRRMRVGFSRAARLIDILEREGILGPAQGSKPREVLVPSNYFEEIDGAPR